MPKILVVEDDESFRETLARFLKTALHEVDMAADGDAARHFLESYEYDLVVLDLQIPGKSGLEICQYLRDRGSKVLILVLTAKRDIADKTLLLDIGADDYVTKPVDLRELRSRITALLRRKNDFHSDTIAAGDLQVDTMRQEVRFKGEPVELGKREFQLLEFMVRNSNRVLPVDQIFEKVWPSDTDVNIEAVRTSIKRLRQKIDPDGKLIETVYGTGYIFNIR